MLSFDSANFSIHHLYVMGFDFMILKTACFKSCTPKIDFFFLFAQLYYWASLYIVVIIQKVH